MNDADCPWTDHGEKLTDVDDAFLVDTLLVSKRIAKALGCEDYNVLQVGLSLPLSFFPYLLTSLILSSSTIPSPISTPTPTRARNTDARTTAG